MSEEQKPSESDAFGAAARPVPEINTTAGNRDEWGRDTTGWINVGGKLRPHP